MNTLYYGDNLDILRRYIKDESVDLIYLDPPFNSNATYNVLFAQKDGTQSSAQIQAFEDTWQWDENAVRTYEEEVEKGGPVADALRAFHLLLGGSNMMAYLTMMAPRLMELRRVLKPTGSIYLHCDPTAGHYLKVLMDAVFGTRQFLNEIAWCHYGGGQSKRWFPRKHDTLLFYCKGETWVFNADEVRVPYESDYRSTVFGKKGDPDQRVYLPNSKGKVPEDFWIINRPYGREHLGYPTQKPLALLERIIQASSNPGDVVLDPFCGCGTAVVAAQKLGRQWIGIDITHLAIGLVKRRLEDAFGDSLQFQVIGEPTTLEEAASLAAQDKYQFQWWALGLVGARPAEGKKGADRGIDGRLYFHDDASGKTKQVILSVKGGNINVGMVRDLIGVVEREKAQMGVFITLEEPTKPMRAEAAQAGFYHSEVWNRDYPRIQILTIAELLEGKGIDMPPMRQVSQTFKRAKKESPKNGEQMGLIEG
jgi:DNA modification methylase